MSDDDDRPVSRLAKVRLDNAAHLADLSARFAFAVIDDTPGFAARREDGRLVLDNRGRVSAPSTEE